jgi:alpha-L-fucosidase
MKKLAILGFVLLFVLQLKAQDYVPAASNLKQRAWFNDARFGLFIHWGPFSIPGSGEWVMNERKLNVHNYTNL